MKKVLAFPRPNRDCLIETHMYLVPLIARKIKDTLPPSFDLDDLISEGYVGLIKAADTWDASRGPFEPRARYKIRMTILDSVRRVKYIDNTMVSLDQPVNSRRRNGVETCNDFTLLDLLTQGKQANLPSGEQETDRITCIDSARKKATVRSAIQELPPRARRVVEIYYYEQNSMGEAAEELGVESSRASQIHHTGLRALSSELTKRGVLIEYETLRSRIAPQRATKAA